MTENGDAGGSMQDRTVVITGATSGIGAVAAEALAARGARVVLIARDRARAEAMMARLREANPAAEPTAHFADLSRLPDIKAVAAAVAGAEPRIDVLVNNAGAMFARRQVTADGLERTFAINHMAYVALTLGLRASLEAAGAARVINTASVAHRGARYGAGDPQSLHRYNGLTAYARSKLYNILFTRELARRWQARGITVNCFHPGVVATRFGDAGGLWVTPLLRLVKLFAISPQEGARTLIHLAAAPEVAGITGRYFEKGRPVALGPAAEDDGAAAALWAETLRLGDLAA